jgi:hypothetical protein
MASKFQGIFKKEKDEEPETSTETPPPSPALPPEPVAEVRPRPQAPAPAAKRPRGRPTGKRSDGEHVQVTAYVRADTHRDVKIALLQAGKGQEFSELVQELLTKWLKSRT